MFDWPGIVDFESAVTLSLSFLYASSSLINLFTSLSSLATSSEGFGFSSSLLILCSSPSVDFNLFWVSVNSLVRDWTLADSTVLTGGCGCDYGCDFDFSASSCSM